MPGPLAAAAVVGAGTLIGGVLANRANKKEAAKNRKFQERMRNTEWQAGVEDMRKAGINPALAYSQGGASAPVGSVAQAQKNVVGDSVSSALAVKMQAAQIDLLEKQSDKTTLEGIKIMAETRVSQDRAMMSSGRITHYFSTDGKATPAMMELIQAEHGATIANSGKSVSQLRLSRLSEAEMEAISKLFAQVGESGKGIQVLMPLIISFLSKR